MFAKLRIAIAVLLTAAFAPVDGARAAATMQDPPVWKTISLGAHAGTRALFAALDAADVHIGDAAEEVLHRPAFTVSKMKIDVQLVRMSIAELGLGADGAALPQVNARAARLGLEPCPPEVAPILRLVYRDQPLGYSLHIAMRPIVTYGGDLINLSLFNGGAGLLLVGFDGRPDHVMPAETVFVFVRPVRVAQPSR